MISSILYFILVLVIIVFVHEFGHFFVAKKCGVKIIEFSIGMGKKIFGIKDKNGVEWKLCLLPIGGYVKMFGDDNASSFGGYSDNPTKEELQYSLIYKHPLKKILVAFAGPFVNFLFGFLLFFMISVMHGKTVVEPIISEVQKGSYAEKAGILKNDKILSINDHNVTSFNDIGQQLQLSIKERNTLHIDILRNDNIIKVKTEYIKGSKLGITGWKIRYEKTTLLDSLTESVNIVFVITWKTAQTLWNIIVHQKDLKNIGGPIAIARESGKASKAGLWQFLYFVALISISLGAVNLIPIPMLDGGHIAVNAIELVTKRRFSNFAYKIFVYVGIGFIVFLMGVGFINDLFINR